MSIIGYILIIIGALFYALGGLGIFRMPDVYNRLQAGTKATTLGAISLILGVGFLNPSWLPKTILIIIFLAITNPVGSSAIGRAAYIIGVKPAKVVVDEMEDKYKRGDENGDN